MVRGRALDGWRMGGVRVRAGRALAMYDVG